MSRQVVRSSRRVLVVAFALALAPASCARHHEVAPGLRSRYPARPPHCALVIVHAPTPGPAVTAYEDLGFAEVTCHLDIGLPQCLQRFRAEICRMGGDLVYDVPEKPLRPREEAVTYRGRVAHTR